MYNKKEEKEESRRMEEKRREDIYVYIYDSVYDTDHNSSFFDNAHHYVWKYFRTNKQLYAKLDT
jgi:hypothetical protein